LGIFNEDNPSGEVVNHHLNKFILKTMIVVGVVISVKRITMALFLGRKTFGKR